MTFFGWLLALCYFMALARAQDGLTKCLESKTHKPVATLEDNLYGEVRGMFFLKELSQIHN